MAGAVPQNAMSIYEFLTARGYTANAAAGILGNIEQESEGNPDAGSNPPGSGLIQQLGYPANTSLAQAEQAILNYDNNIIGSALVAQLNQQPNPTAAALFYSENFEKPNAALANNANREASAVLVAQAAQSGNWPGNATLGAGTTTTTEDSSTCAGITLFGHCIGIQLPNLGADIVDWLERGALIVMGGIIVVMGLIIMTGKGGEKVGNAAAGESDAVIHGREDR
jgi:hypothetical protein